MTWWKRFTAIFRSEAADVGEGLRTVGKSLDAELARKERELAATPEERIDMILEEQQADDARFEELADRVRGASAEPEAVSELDESPDQPDSSDAGA